MIIMRVSNSNWWRKCVLVSYAASSHTVCCNLLGESAPPERQVSPEKLYRAALLRSRFADTILKAQEKTLEKVGLTIVGVTLVGILSVWNFVWHWHFFLPYFRVKCGTLKSWSLGKRSLKGEGEKVWLFLVCTDFTITFAGTSCLFLSTYAEKARLQAEAKAAGEARREAEAEAAAEAKKKRELEREAARQALLKVMTYPSWGQIRFDHLLLVQLVIVFFPIDGKDSWNQWEQSVYGRSGIV